MGRYDGVEVATAEVPDGSGGVRQIRYLRRRALPRHVRPLAVHRVAASDRLDLVANRYVGDPTAWWQIADAGAALDPDELVGPEAEGDLIVIPFPEV